MSEIDQLKERIDSSGIAGIKTAIIRDDYEPVGDLMMISLLDSGEYVQRRYPEWRIYKKGFEPFSKI